MPNSNDNQDLEQDKVKDDKNGLNENVRENAQSDMNQFTSDNLKGKKVDADPEQESDKPADV
ncbi:MAG TPA: hypothetical protein VF622_17200 [Segetibacter sp.]